MKKTSILFVFNWTLIVKIKLFITKYHILFKTCLYHLYDAEPKAKFLELESGCYCPVYRTCHFREERMVVFRVNKRGKIIITMLSEETGWMNWGYTFNSTNITVQDDSGFGW